MASQLGHGPEQTLRTYGHVIAEYEDRPRIDAEIEIRLARGLDVPATYPRPPSTGDPGPA